MREIAHIPRTASDRITYVQDEAICRRALPVYNAETGVTSLTTGKPISKPSTQLYVVQVDTVYAALDPQQTFGEYALLVVMDQRYRHLASTGL